MFLAYWSLQLLMRWHHAQFWLLFKQHGAVVRSSADSAEWKEDGNTESEKFHQFGILTKYSLT